MAAYASLVSLMSVINQIQHHPQPPITLHDEQVESLCKNITFLQEFLEVYPHGVISDAAELESRIMEVAYAAEDIIESHVVDQILSAEKNRKKRILINMMKRFNVTSVGESTSLEEDNINMTGLFYQSLDKVIHDFDFLKKKVMEIKKRISTEDRLCPTLTMHSAPTGVVKCHSKRSKSNMVGFEDVLFQLLDKLTGYQSCRQIISMVGMGGIGKTTLARNAYEDQLIMHHFDIRFWVTISQEYNMQDILRGLLSQGKNKERGEDSSEKSEEKLGEEVYKKLSGKRYLIIMDDVWSIEVWNKVKCFFPDNNTGSRIIITTRMSNMALKLTSHIIKLNFLSKGQSWKLLCKNVFGEEACPFKLQDVSRKIAKSCKGLPLSIEVISGLLSKSTRTQEFWGELAENFNSVLSMEDNERCLKILHTSYSHLPIHLKPCFLYMGVFPEDTDIRASVLIKQWVGEGFLKPIKGKSMEATAEEYLEELVDRNLILTKSLKFDGRIKYCCIHDLLRDVCLKEAIKEKFFCIFRMNNLGVQLGMNNARRIISSEIKLRANNFNEVISKFQSSTLARSLVIDFEGAVSYLPFKLLRVLRMSTTDKHFKETKIGCSREAISQFVNSRFLCVNVSSDHWASNHFWRHSKIHLFWSLQTLIIEHPCTAPLEIWNIHQLRHVKIPAVTLSNPSSEEQYGLWNLQSLSTPYNFELDDNVVKKIPNIRRLHCYYNIHYTGVEYPSYCIKNLKYFQKLESLTLRISNESRQYSLHQNLNLPHSLKKLRLTGVKLHWEDVTAKLGSLPLLQVLRVHAEYFKGSEWNLEEGKFCSLRILRICNAYELENWVVESIHFPRLEHISLGWMRKLKKIPSELGEIPTLQSIKLEACSESVVASAMRIQEEQEELGNFGLIITTGLRC